MCNDTFDVYQQRNDYHRKVDPRPIRYRSLAEDRASLRALVRWYRHHTTKGRPLAPEVASVIRQARRNHSILIGV